MYPASNLRMVEHRARKYLLDDPDSALIELRRFVESNILSIGRAGILGGLVRELARIGRVGFRSDVDLVIDAPASDVAEVARFLGAEPNRFGGFCFRHPLWKVDFWALETTWAIKQGLVAVSELDDVTQCTFFDCDSIFFDLNSNRVSASTHYLARLRSKILEINLLPNPSPEGNLVRAVRRLLYWDFLPGPKLKAFIIEHLDRKQLARLIETEHKLYNRSAAEYFGTVELLLEALFTRRRKGLRTAVPEF